MYVDFNKRPDLWRVEGAETFAQVRDRTLEGIRQIAAENPGGTVAAARAVTGKTPSTVISARSRAMILRFIVCPP